MKAVSEFVHKLFVDKQFDCLTVSFGCKQVNGSYTDEKSIRIGVREKLNKGDIPPGKLVPKTITVDGITYQTDVFVAPPMTASMAMPIACNSPEPSINSLPTNDSAFRPLIGGTSLTTDATPGVGTLGGMVIDNYDGTIAGLTNNHVAVPNAPGTPYHRLPMFQVSDPLYGAKFAQYGTIPCYQGGGFIGNVKRRIPFRSYNTCDVALINLNTAICSTGSWQQRGSPFTAPPPFASTSEINSLNANVPIFVCGRTTGPKGGFDSACQIRVTDIYQSVAVDYGTIANPNLVSFYNTLSFSSPVTNSIVSWGGDSGAFLYAFLSGAWKLVGINFAASNSITFGSFGTAARIDEVAAALNVVAYQGSAIPVNAAAPSYVDVDYYANLANDAITHLGKTYWVAGRL